MRIICCSILLCAIVANAWADILPSWQANSQSRQEIITFVQQVSEPGPHFVPEEDRIAVFDNDGTLWAEQPAYFQLFFAIDRIKLMQEQHPEWKTTEPFKSVLSGDLKTALSSEENIKQLIVATHTGMTQAEFHQQVSDWIDAARHPETNRKYSSMIYQPMLELLEYLRANGFKTYIVSGGGIDFMRPWTESVYGIPPTQVVGSRVKKAFVIEDGKAMIKRLPEMEFIDDKAGKPIGIDLHIGKRPIMAVGNSDGDLQMLQYTMAGNGKRLAVFIHHTDGEREWAYDRDSTIGRFDEGLDEAKQQNWVVVDMAKEWKTIFLK